MSDGSSNHNSNELFLLNIDLRPVDTRHAISAIRKYLQIMEEQMPVVQLTELASLEADRPPGDDEEELSIHNSIVNHTENLFEDDLIPTMRYSFIVFLHTVFETRLRDLCSTIRRERNLPIALSDLRGSAIEQARGYLSKLASIPVGGYADWAPIRNFQKIRDCIVHDYGFVKRADDRFRRVVQIVDSDQGLSLNDWNRICPSHDFCFRQLGHVESFLNQLMTDMGWKLH